MHVNCRGARLTSAQVGRHPVAIRWAYRAVLFVAGATLLAGGAGCDTRPPQVRTGALVIENETADHARVLLRLELHNPNSGPIPLEEISYRVGPYAGLRHPGITLPPESDVTLDLPVVVPIAMLDRTMNASGSIVWTPIGVIGRSLHDARVVRRRAGFSGSTAVKQTNSTR